MEVPIRATDLNAWLRTHCQCLEGAKMAYLQFPLDARLMINEKEEYLTLDKRVIFSTIKLTGREEDCCREVHQALLESIPEESLQDQNSIVCIRAWFTYGTDVGEVHGCLYGRLAFWDTTLDKKFFSHRFAVHEAAIPRPALSPMQLEASRARNY